MVILVRKEPHSDGGTDGELGAGRHVFLVVEERLSCNTVSGQVAQDIPGGGILDARLKGVVA